MDRGKKKFSGRETPKKKPSLGLVIALAVAGGAIIGSAGTYILTRPLAAPEQSASPAADGVPPTPTVTMPTISPQQQYTPAPQPPGPVPPGKVWSVEHGHWHDAPVAPAISTPVPAPVPALVTPAATVTPAPAPVAAPVEKKE